MTRHADRPLTERQRSVLNSLNEHKTWHERCGWTWDTPSGTRKLLDALVAKGFARAFKCPTRGMVYATLRPPEEHRWVEDAARPGKVGFCTCGWPSLEPTDALVKTKAEWTRHAKGKKTSDG